MARGREIGRTVPAGGQPGSVTLALEDGPVDIYRNGTLAASGVDAATWDDTGLVGGHYRYRVESAAVQGLSFPTHPSQTGLSALGINRDELPSAGNPTFTSSDSGATVEGVRFTGVTRIDGAVGMTFRQCWFMGGGSSYMLQGVSAGENTTIEDCDFGSTGEANYASQSNIAFLGSGSVIQRCNLYLGGDAIKFRQGTTTYVDYCWCQSVAVGDNHNDVWQIGSDHVCTAYITNCVAEMRGFTVNGVPCYAHEELTAPIGSIGIFDWGNSIFQQKPCEVANGCSGPIPGAFISVRNSIHVGGNYVHPCEAQNGEWVDNVCVKGTGQVNQDSDGEGGWLDQDHGTGLRGTKSNYAISGNRFHTGEVWDGGFTSPNDGTSDWRGRATPISRLDLSGLT